MIYSPLIITMGDPNGIGPEICLKLLDKKPKTKHPVVIAGDLDVLEKAKRMLNLKCNLREINSPEQAHSVKGISVLNGKKFKEDVKPGKISLKAGAASIAWVHSAVEFVLAKKAAGIVTAPICKEAVEKTVRGFQGHTEYIGEMCGDSEPVLALVHKNWVVAHVSTHVSLKESIERATKERIVKTGKLLNEFLKKIKNIQKPRIGVAGINPHAGEGGLFGNEEKTNIIPAILGLNKQKINAVGPIPADVVFPQLKSGVYDGVIAMYHDQGHVVTKTLLFNFGKTKNVSGVNTTLGLPVVRTSVDHGVGFDIAWQNKADCGSLRDALLLADKISP